MRTCCPCLRLWIRGHDARAGRKPPVTRAPTWSVARSTLCNDTCSPADRQPRGNRCLPWRVLLTQGPARSGLLAELRVTVAGRKLSGGLLRQCGPVARVRDLLAARSREFAFDLNRGGSCKCVNGRSISSGTGNLPDMTTASLIPPLRHDILARGDHLSDPAPWL
jgi:hypothetical protein